MLNNQIYAASSGAESEEIEIQVINYIENSNDIILNVGLKDNVLPGVVVYLYENNSKIGFFNIIQTEAEQSIAKVNPLVITKIKAGAKLKIIKKDSMFDAGNFNFNSGNYELALEYYTRYLKENPDHYPSKYNIALIYIKQKKYEKASNYLNDALKLNPFHNSIIKTSAICDFITDNENEFVDKSKRVIALNYQDINIKLLLSMILSKYKKYDLSNQTLNLDNDKIDLLKSINLINLKNYSGALTLLHKNQNSENEFYSINIEGLTGISYQLSGKKEKSEEYMLKFFKKNPELKNNPPEQILANIENNVKGYMSQQIIAQEFGKINPLPITISKISSLIALHNQRQLDIEARKLERETQSKSYTKSKFNTTTTYEVKDKRSSTAQTNPVPGANYDFNLSYQNKIGDYTLQSSVKYFRNHWDGVALDEFKSSISNNDIKLSLGKFSARNFADLVKHPSVEYGFGTEIKLDNLINKKRGKTDIFDEKTSVSEMFYNSKAEKKYFANNLITFASGVTKESINVNQQKEKNEGQVESGQYLQYTFALNYRTNPLKKMDLGLSVVHTAEDENSALIDSASIQPKRNTSYGFDMTYQLMKNLKFLYEYGVSYIDYDITNETRSVKDNSFQTELNYKFLSSNFGSFFEKSFLKFVGKWNKSNDLDVNIKIKTISGDWYVEGGDQGSEGGKRTITYSIRHTKKEEKKFHINATDFKYEKWKNNLNGLFPSKTGFTSKTTLKTLFPLGIAYEASYQLESEWCSNECSDKTEKIFDHILNFSINPISTKFVFNYNRDYKHDESNASNPDQRTDEKKKFYGLAADNSLLKFLPLKLAWQLEHKYYYPSVDAYTYKDVQLSAETTYKFKNISNNFKYTYNFKKFSDPSTSGHENKYSDKVSLTISYKYNADLSLFAKYQYTDEHYKPQTTSEYIENNYKLEVKYNF